MTMRVRRFRRQVELLVGAALTLLVPVLTGASLMGHGLAAQEPVNEPAPAARPEDREAQLLFNTASHLYRQKSWREAANAFGDFLRRFPRHVDAAEARCARGFCLYRLGQYAQAVEDFKAAQAAVREGSKAREGAAWAAEAAFYHGRSLEALAAGEKSGSTGRAELLRAAAENFGQAARLYALPDPKRGRIEEPADEGAKRKGAEPPSRLDLEVLALNAQGEALYQAGLFSESKQALAPLGAREKRYSPSSHYVRGLYLLALATYAEEDAAGQTDHAGSRRLLSSLVERAPAGDPVADEASFFLGRLLHRLGSLPQAIERYEPVAAGRGPKAAEAACWRAIALYESNDRESRDLARRGLSDFLRQHSDHPLAPRARFYAALCLFDEKRYGEAAKAFESAARDGGELAGLASLRLGQALLLADPPDAAAAARALASAEAALGREATAGSRAPFEARYWRAEALLARGGNDLPAAATVFIDVHERAGEAAPDLAEKALVQAARSQLLAGRRRECADLARRYRETYTQGKHVLESLKLSAENAFRAAPGELDDAESAEAAGYYTQAAALEKDPAEARRLIYLAGVARYDRGELVEAAQVLAKVREESRVRPIDGFREPELPFFLGNALARMPRPEKPAADDLARWQLSAALFKEYLGAQPDGVRAPAARVNLGLCFLWLGQDEEARGAFEDFLRAHPRDPLASQVRMELGGLYAKSGGLEKAEAQYKEAAKSEDPVLAARALLAAAGIEGRGKKHKEALALLQGAEEKLRQTDGEAAAALRLEARLQKSTALTAAGRKDEARRELEEFLATAPSGAGALEARLQLANLLLEGGDARAALKSLAPLIEEAQGAQEAPRAAGRDQALYLQAWCFRALLQEKAPQEKDAPEKDTGADKAEWRRSLEASYKKLLAEHPESALAADAMVELAQQLLEAKDLAGARTQFEAACARLEGAGGENAGGRTADLLDRARFGSGLVAFEEKNFQAARKHFDRAASRADSPLAPRALLQSARAWMASRGEKEAADRLQKALADRRPEAAEVREECLLRLGECLHRLEKYAEAAATLETMLKDYPRGALLHDGLLALGFARQFQDDYPAAIEAYRKVVAGTQAPAAARAQYHIGECFVDQGKNREAAREFLAVAANFDFEGPYREWVRRALLAAGAAYQSAGDVPAARAQLEDLLKLFPDTDEGRAAKQRLAELK